MHVHLVQQIKANREFHRLIRQRRPRRRSGPLPRQRQPDMIRLAYYSEIRRRVLQPALVMVEHRLIPRVRELVGNRGDSRMDAGPGDINEIVDGITIDLDDQLDNEGLDGLAFKYAHATSDYQRDELARQLQSAVGVQVPLTDQTLGPVVQNFMAENVALIKSIPDRYLNQLATTVLRDISEGKRWEEVAKDMEDRYEVSESTAKLIARDQVGKFFGALNEARQTELGIERFTWRTVGDNRVREEHDELNGQSFEWADPPSEGIPGEPINCRCSAEPDLTDVLDQLDEAA